MCEGSRSEASPLATCSASHLVSSPFSSLISAARLSLRLSPRRPILLHSHTNRFLLCGRHLGSFPPPRNRIEHVSHTSRRPCGGASCCCDVGERLLQRCEFGLQLVPACFCAATRPGQDVGRVFWHPTILVRFAGEPQSLEKGFGCNLRPQHGRCEPETDEIDSAERRCPNEQSHLASHDRRRCWTRCVRLFGLHPRQ